MKKTLNINLGGMIFHIDDDAFKKLESYLGTLRGQFQQTNGGDEIINDVEQRMAELFRERTGPSKEVINVNDVDEVIAIIREEDEPKPVLMKRFKLSDIQAEAILNLRLRNLAKLEEFKIRGEQDELQKERDLLEKTLNSAARLKTLIKKEILEDAQAYGDERRTEIVQREAAQALDETQLVASEPVTVVLSQAGYARAAKGHEIDPGTLAELKSRAVELKIDPHFFT